VTDVSRALRIREDKPALQNLLQKGSIGDDLWNSLLAAEKELEGEVREVVAEANTFVEGWGAIIFPTANEVIANEKMRTIFEQNSKIRAEKELAYGRKTWKDLSRVPLPAFSVGTPHLNLPPPGTPTSGPRSAVSPTSTSHSLKASNGLVAPSSAGAESIASSDNESSRSPSTPRTPKSGKKGKKRK